MALLLKNNAIFLHVPKTGGNWITHALTDMGLVRSHFGHKHTDFEHLNFASYTFCFVRNPLSWLESWFRYQTDKGWLEFGSESEWHPCQPLNGLGDKDFNQFIMNVLTHCPGFVSKMYSGYANCDFVGKQENLVDDLITVLRGTECDFDEDKLRSYPRLNVSTLQLFNWRYRHEVGIAESDTLARYGYT